MLLRSLTFTASLRMANLLAYLSRVAIVVWVIVNYVDNRRMMVFFSLIKRVFRFYSVLLHWSEIFQGTSCSWEGFFHLFHVIAGVPNAQVGLIFIILRDIVACRILYLIHHSFEMVLQGMECVVYQRFRWPLIWLCKGFLGLIEFMNNRQLGFSETNNGFFWRQMT